MSGAQRQQARMVIGALCDAPDDVTGGDSSPWEAAEAKPGQEAKALRENKRVG